MDALPGEDRMTPDEFARLMSLPADHPDRVAAEADVRFASLRRLLAEFERPTDAERDEPATRDAARSVAARVIAAHTGTPAGPAVTPLPPAGHQRRSAPTVGWLALAAAGIAVASSLTWWSLRAPGSADRMRGGEPAGVFRLVSAGGAGDSIALAWSHVPEADAYRIVFLGDDLAEVAHLDVGPITRFTILPDSLPAGVVHGARGSLQVVALHGGIPLATTPTRAVVLP